MKIMKSKLIQITDLIVVCHFLIFCLKIMKPGIDAIRCPTEVAIVQMN